MSEAIEATKTLVNGTRVADGLIIIQLPEISRQRLDDATRSVATFVKYGVGQVEPKLFTDSLGAGVQHFVSGADECTPVTIEQWGSVVSTKEVCTQKMIYVKIVVQILGNKDGFQIKIGNVEANEIELGPIETYIKQLDNDPVYEYEIHPLRNPPVALCNGKSMIRTLP